MSEAKTRLFELPVTDQGIFSTDGLRLIVRRLKGFVERSWEENGSIILEVEDSTDAEELLQEIITGDGLACADCEFDYIGSDTEYGLCKSCQRYRDDSAAAMMPGIRREYATLLTYDRELDGLFLAGGKDTAHEQYEELRHGHPELAKLYD